MCGIFSLLNTTLTKEQLELVLKSFMIGKLRGPEQSDLIKVFTNTIFGFHRLAINGLNTKSNQPIYYNGIILICNGEIYNYKSLIDILNLQFTTDSDCEIIIHLYLKYGAKTMIQMLDGVFAFTLLDLRHDTPLMYVARDIFGVRPLFKYSSNISSNISSNNSSTQTETIFGFSSEIKMITPLEKSLQLDFTIQPFLPGTISKFNFINDKWSLCYNNTYYSLNMMPFINSMDNALSIIQKTLIQAVKKRVQTTDRPIACLLSGGLDSSLIASIVSKLYKSQNGSKLETYSIGMPGSEDLKYAKKVAEYINSNHTEIVVSPQEFLDTIPKVIYMIESFDTTTVRASVGNYLVSKYISENSDAKVIFNGDGSDEVTGGYMYFHCAPDMFAFDGECKRLLSDIHYFDVLRSDRSIASNGLEARTPFLDKMFVQSYLSINSKLRFHKLKNQCEKWLLRYAFEPLNLLPQEVLWRTKEAFSDGVSSQSKSWFEIIQEYVDNNNLGCCEITNHMTPITAEQKYYRGIFQEKFGEKHSNVIPYFWMPRFVEGVTDSSARTLNIYKDKI